MVGYKLLESSRDQGIDRGFFYHRHFSGFFQQPGVNLQGNIGHKFPLYCLEYRPFHFDKLAQKMCQGKS
jgi:hypothetical protein